MNGKIFGNSLVKAGFVTFALALGLAACGGDNGVDGKDGVNGVDGKDGVNGVDGKDGVNGVDGKDGVNGIDGKDGVNGTDGKDGVNGVDGKDGVNGSDGKDGANGKDGTSCELKIAKDSSYYEITCGDKTISVPLNGNSGQNVGTNTGVGVNPDDAYLTFDRRVYVGDNSAAKITMKNEALKGDSVVVKFCASECKNIALRKDKDVFTKTIYLNGTENQKDNFAVIENGKVKVNYADLDVSLADSATWLLKAQGYVQFGQDVYTTPFTQPTVYLYDDDNLNDFAYVTVSSSKNKEGVKVKLSRYSDYFYGTFEMSVAGGSSNVLEIENGKKIGVAYYDSSMAATQIDSATINFPENTYNATLSFGDTRYNGYEDKAVINLTDYFLTTQVPAKVSVWSDSDVDGCEVDLFPTSGGLVGYMRIGYVEFVSKKTDKACALVVSEGDNIYAEYESAYGNKTVKATATWGKADAAKSSSSSVILSDSEGSSSSSAKSSSSVASSSSVTTSSSVASSSSTSVPGSSSSVIPGTDPESPSSSSEKDDSSSSVAPSSSSVILSSSSEESSSSVASSSSEESSSSVTSSSSVVSSSSSSVIPGTDPGSPSSSSVIQSSSSEGTSIKDGSKYDASANTLTDLRDGQVYKTVTIGTQTWMAENLNYAYTGVKYNYDGYTSDSTSWCYDNKASNCDKYGRLYTWSAVMDSAAQFSVNAGTKCGFGKTCTPNSPHRGICPEGWHVPTNEEYSTLYTYIGGSSTAGSLLKSTSGWNDYNGKSGNGTDKYGFSVLPAGSRSYGGYFNLEGSLAYLWSASEYSSYDAWYQYFNYDYDTAYQNLYYKDYGLSLRCLKDS